LVQIDLAQAIKQNGRQMAWVEAYDSFKEDYENRLKADMVAMLTDIQTEIEELRLDRPLMSRGYECYGFEDKTPTEIKKECSDIIQQKIDALKADGSEENETWNGIHAQITAPKGTFERIFNDAEDDTDI
jgi:hypothetical protein